MKKYLILAALLISYYCGLANTFVSNTSNSFTLNWPCGPLTNGTYTVQLNYFDLNIGDWVPGPDQTGFTTYTNVVVTVNSTTGDVVYNFSNSSPAANFPIGIGDSQGWIKVTSAGMQMNWDNHQLNCPSLPVTLTSFTGNVTTVGGKAQVNFAWTTETESNSCVFVLERYINNVWTPIGRVAASGNTSSTHNYNFVFLYPVLGSTQYRLKIVDLDNHTEFSQIRLISVSCSVGSTCIRTPVSCSYTISGAASFCSGGQSYSINTPAAAGVLWSLTPASYPGTLIPNDCGNAAIISKVGNGPVTLTASVTGCSNTFSKVVQLGPNATFTYTLNNGLINANANVSGYSAYQWTLNLGAKGTFTFSGQSLFYQMPKCSGGALNLTVTTPCGQATDGATVWNPNCSAFMVAPTKAADRISIRQGTGDETQLQKSADAKVIKPKKEGIREVIIYDNFMNVKMQTKYPANTTKLDLDVSSIQPGNYILEIWTDSDKQTEKIQIIR